MWFARVYDPVQVGSIDGTDRIPHDRAITRATKAYYRPPHRRGVTKDPLCTLFVGRLNPDTTDEGLRQAFSKFGTIKQATVVVNFVTGVSRCYGFVEFESEHACRRAYQRAHRMSIDDRVILVDYERARVMQGWIPRRLGGGFGGKKESGQLRFGARDRPFKRPIVRADLLAKKNTLSEEEQRAELQRLQEIEKAARQQTHDDCWREDYIASRYASHHIISTRRSRSRSYDRHDRRDESRSEYHHRHRRRSTSRRRRDSSRDRYYDKRSDDRYYSSSHSRRDRSQDRSYSRHREYSRDRYDRRRRDNHSRRHDQDRHYYHHRSRD